MKSKTKGILVVSFGTTHEDTRIRSIESIENNIREEFPDYVIYRAWTSDVIRRVLKKRENLVIDSVEEALLRMKQDGITEVVVQPTHVINGFETDAMKVALLKYKDSFAAFRIGTPLLTTQEDNEKIVEMLKETWKDIPDDEAVVLMGHGTEHYANTVYAALDYLLKLRGLTNIHVGTVEAFPSVDTVKGIVEKTQPKKVHLSPFMIVAGDHAKNDMAGEEEDSWKSQFEQMGFEVQCHLSGLGESRAVQNMFAEHVREAK